ncbi:MAG: dephospho-CoA kinase [Thermoguttaceae bacterium]
MLRIIGLLGGVASGKSTVAHELARLGAGVLDADRAGHEVLRLAHVEAAVRRRWGEAVFGPDGHVDRRRLKTIVFAPPPAGPPERKYLEGLTHPEIGRLLQAQAAAMEAGGVKIAVLDAPLILEAGWDKLCEKLVFVDSPAEVRLARALGRGWNEEEFAARQAAQESLDLKRRRADVIIDNAGSPQRTAAQVEHFWHSLVGS